MANRGWRTVHTNINIICRKDRYAPGRWLATLKPTDRFGAIKPRSLPVQFPNPFRCSFQSLKPEGIDPLSRFVWLSSVVACCSMATATANESAAKAWESVPLILSRIVPPVFPPRQFDITSYGAMPGGSTDCTAAFAGAIKQCAAAGGGRVLVPKGQFLSGPIHLQSNVELHLADGAEIIFSDRFEDYLPVVLVRVGGIELYNYSPLIYARDCTNIAVTGPGKLNGNAKKWWDWKSSETTTGFEMGAKGVPVEQRVFGKPEFCIRPSFLSFVSCTQYPA